MMDEETAAPADTVSDLAVINAPWGREITLRGTAYASGLRTVNMRIRENKRFTDIELDEATCRALAEHFARWFADQA